MEGLQVEMASLKIVFDVVVKLFNIKNIKNYEGIKQFEELNFSFKNGYSLRSRRPKTMIHDQKHIQSLKNFLVIFINGFASMGTFDLA